MGKKNKPAKRNGFFMCVLDYKNREEKRGRVFQNMKEVTDMASSYWQCLSEDRKDYFNQRAKEYNARMKANPVPYNALQPPPPVPPVHRPNPAVEYISKFIQSKDIPTLIDQPFYLIHVNVFVITDDNEVFPAELGISEFTLRAGISRVLHRLFPAGRLAEGYDYTAKEHTRQTHRIPFDLMRNDVGYLGYYKKLCDFLMEGKEEMPPLYTMTDNPNCNFSMKAVKYTLKRIWETANVEDEEDGEVCDEQPWEKEFKVLPLHVLFYELKNKCAQFNDANDVGFSNSSLAMRELTRDVYAYDEDISCKFHRDEDRVKYCSQSYAVRWARVIAKQCSAHLRNESPDSYDQKPDTSQINIAPVKEERLDNASVKLEKIDHHPFKEEKDVDQNVAVKQEKAQDNRGSGQDVRVKPELPERISHNKNERNSSNLRPDAVTVKRERICENANEVPTTSAAVSIKSEKDRRYGDMSGAPSHRSQSKALPGTTGSAPIKDEPSRGYSNDTRAPEVVTFEQKRAEPSNTQETVCVKDELSRGYADETRAPEVVTLKEERAEPRNTQGTVRVKGEPSRGYADEKRAPEIVTLEEERTEPRNTQETVRIKGEPLRGYADETRIPEVVTLGEEPTKSRNTQENARVKRETSRGYADEARVPEVVTIREEHAEPKNTQGTPRVKTEPVKGEPSRGYTDEIRAPEVVTIKQECIEPRNTLETSRVKAEPSKGYADETRAPEVVTIREEGVEPRNTQETSRVKAEPSRGYTDETRAPEVVTIKQERTESRNTQETSRVKAEPSRGYTDETRAPKTVTIKHERTEPRNTQETSRVKAEPSRGYADETRAPEVATIKNEHAEPRNTQETVRIKTERSESTRAPEVVTIRSERSTDTTNETRTPEVLTIKSERSQGYSDERKVPETPVVKTERSTQSADNGNASSTNNVTASRVQATPDVTVIKQEKRDDATERRVVPEADREINHNREVTETRIPSASNPTNTIASQVNIKKERGSTSNNYAAASTNQPISSVKTEKITPKEEPITNFELQPESPMDIDDSLLDELDDIIVLDSTEVLRASSRVKSEPQTDTETARNAENLKRPMPSGVKVEDDGTNPGSSKRIKTEIDPILREEDLQISDVDGKMSVEQRYQRTITTRQENPSKRTDSMDVSNVKSEYTVPVKSEPKERFETTDYDILHETCDLDEKEDMNGRNRFQMGPVQMQSTRMESEHSVQVLKVVNVKKENTNGQENNSSHTTEIKVEKNFDDAANDNFSMKSEFFTSQDDID